MKCLLDLGLVFVWDSFTTFMLITETPHGVSIKWDLRLLDHINTWSRNLMKPFLIKLHTPDVNQLHESQTLEYVSPFTRTSY